MKNIDGNKIVSFVETYLNKNIKNILDDDLLNVNILPLFYTSEEANNNFDVDYICKMFPNLKKIIFNGFNIDDNLLIHLKYLNIDEVVFNNCIINDIKYIFNAKRISINNCEIKSLNFLSNNVNLEYLKIYDNRNTVFDLDYISSLKKISILELKGLKILSSKNISNNSINKLIVFDNYFYSSFFEFVKSITSLKQIYINSDYKKMINTTNEIEIIDDYTLLYIDDESFEVE